MCRGDDYGDCTSWCIAFERVFAVDALEAFEACLAMSPCADPVACVRQGATTDFPASPHPVTAAYCEGLAECSGWTPDSCEADGVGFGSRAPGDAWDLFTLLSVQTRDCIAECLQPGGMADCSRVGDDPVADCMRQCGLQDVRFEGPFQ